MKEFLLTTVAVLALAFVAYPTLTEAPIEARSEPVLDIRPKATVIFGGDMMFDRTIRKAMEVRGEDSIFSCIAGILHEADMVVANLEGPITEHPSMSLGSEIGSPENFTFTFPPSTAPFLARHNIRLVNLGNNHIQNFGWEGVRSTLEYLGIGGVGHFGDPLEKRVAQIDIKRVQFTFINYNEFAPSGWRESASTTRALIRAARADGRVPIVYAHWGDEYSLEVPQRVREFAYSFIDAGAALVIGSHPHVVQEREEYAGTYIYYSLGNFVFDQYWNEAVRTGLLVRVSFTDNGVLSVEELPISLERDGRTCLKTS